MKRQIKILSTNLTDNSEFYEHQISMEVHETKVNNLLENEHVRIISIENYILPQVIVTIAVLEM